MLTSGINQREAFSVIEMIVVIAVIGIIITPMISAFNNSLKSSRLTQQKRNAQMLAESCLSRLESTVRYGGLPGDGDAVQCNGMNVNNEPYTFSEPHDDYSYVTVVNQLSDDGGDLPLKRIRIKVVFSGPYSGGERCINTKDCSEWDASVTVSKKN